MKVQIILVDECGDDVIADTIDERAVNAMGEHLDSFVEMRINQIKDSYPEARWVYREDIKSQGELDCELWEEIYNKELEWALSEDGQQELGNDDPYEYAKDMADSYMQNRYYF